MGTDRDFTEQIYSKLVPKCPECRGYQLHHFGKRFEWAVCLTLPACEWWGRTEETERINAETWLERKRK